jgi:NADH:ubiquinone oxidoreductase subunit B-like Fe-S oxidoreductase
MINAAEKSINFTKNAAVIKKTLGFIATLAITCCGIEIFATVTGNFKTRKSK